MEKDFDRWNGEKKKRALNVWHRSEDTCLLLDAMPSVGPRLPPRWSPPSPIPKPSDLAAFLRLDWARAQAPTGASTRTRRGSAIGYWVRQGRHNALESLRTPDRL